MKVCWFGIYDPGYSRNKVLMDGLRENGVEVVECNARGKGIGKYISLIQQLRALKNSHDFIYCAFPVYVNIMWAFFFQKRPIVTDAFFSKYDSVVHDRKTYARFHPKALFFYLLDRFMVTLSDVLIVDTHAHKVFFSRWCSPSKLHVIPVGTHTGEFFPTKDTREENHTFLVQFHGYYIPLQGVEHIVEAANLLKDRRDIRFRFIGKGQTFKDISAKVEELKLTNIEFIPDIIPINALNEKLNEADVVLGIFGDTPKTNRVIPNKLYQGIAVRKPVITKDTLAIREEFSEEELMLVSNDGKSIAEAIMELYADTEKRSRLAAHGYQKIQNELNQGVLGKKLLKILEDYSRRSA